MGFVDVIIVFHTLTVAFFVYLLRIVVSGAYQVNFSLF